MSNAYEPDFVVDSHLLESDPELPEPDPADPGSIGLRNVLGGSDERVRVPSIGMKPFRWVCQILASAAGSTKMGVGSGFVIGRHTILTAGHNLFVRGNRASSFDIFLAVDGDRHSPRMGRYQSSDAVLHPRYQESISDFDLAMIRLREPLRLDTLTAPYSYAAMPLVEVQPAWMRGQKGFVTGYPKAYPESDRVRFLRPPLGTQAFQYYCVSQMRPTPDNRLLAYDLDTEGGQSGSPLIATHQNASGRQYSVAIGVHIEGGDDVSGNMAVPLDSDRLEFVTQTLARFEGRHLV